MHCNVNCFTHYYYIAVRNVHGRNVPSILCFQVRELPWVLATDISRYVKQPPREYS